MRNLLRGRDNGHKHPDLSLHSYHYVPQNHAIFDSLPHLLATITLSPTASWRERGERRWRIWFQQAMESAIEPLILFAKQLRPYINAIIASATHPLNTSVIEGINNRIKVIKRMAYGFRDNDYFFLKIKADFPGLPR